MAFSKIRPRGDTKSKWEAANPVLLEREIGVEWENTIGVGEVNIKFGDGVKHWNELDYAVVSDIKKKIISSFAEVTAENPDLEEGSTLDLILAVTKKKFEYLNMQINGIKTMIGAFSNITIESGGVDQAAADITNAIQLLNSGKLSTADIYNGLDSTNALLALSALQGHDLNSKIEKLNGDLSLNVSNANLIDTILPILDTIGKTCSGFFRETTDLTTQAQGYAYGFTAYRIHEKVIRVMANRVYSGIVELYDYEIDKSAWSYKGSLLSDLQQAPTTVTLTRTENPYVSATSFNRIAAKKIGPNLIWIEFNVAIDLEEFPSGGNAVEIGKINGILSGHVPALFNIPAQNGSGTILLEVYNGALRILNWSGSPVSSFVRTTFVMIASFA